MAKFAQLYNVLKNGSMKDLDDKSNAVMKRCTVVSIWRDGKGVHGQLRHMRSDGAAGPRLEPVEGTLFTRQEA